MLYKFLDHGLHGFAFDVDFFNAGMIVRGRRADVWLFGGIELLVYDDAVLEVIQAQVSCLRKAHRTQVPGHLDAACVRRFHCRAELRARDVHVGFERSDSRIDPIVHQLDSLFRIFELVELRSEGTHALEIGSGNVQLGPRDLSRVDQFLQREVGVGLETTGGSQGGNTSREIQARKTKAHFSV